MAWSNVFVVRNPGREQRRCLRIHELVAVWLARRVYPRQGTIFPTPNGLSLIFRKMNGLYVFRCRQTLRHEMKCSRLKEAGDESQRQSRFGPFMIFESTNRYVAYQVEPAATEMQIDFAQLPPWIVRHSNDRRIVSSNADPDSEGGN